jgi:cell division protein FtsX
MMPTKLTSVSIMKGILDLPKTKMITCPTNCGMSSMMTLMKSTTHTIEEHPTLQIEFTRSVDDFTIRKARNKISQVTSNER